MKKNISLSDLLLVLPEGFNRRKIKRTSPVSLEEYTIIISNIVTGFNINNLQNLKEKYKIYSEQINNKIYFFNLTSLGIYSKFNTHLLYYLDRGWDDETSKRKLKQNNEVNKNVKRYSSRKINDNNRNFRNPHDIWIKFNNGILGNNLLVKYNGKDKHEVCPVNELEERIKFLKSDIDFMRVEVERILDRLKRYEVELNTIKA